jgi:aldehyde:ferredoxin oxidoreductase
MENLGEDIFRKKYELKKKFGFRYEDITLPKRFFETVTTTGKLEEERVRKAIEMYREKRGV